MSRATDEILAAAKLLEVAAIFVPDGVAKSEVGYLARRCVQVVENVKDAEAGKTYPCLAGCGAVSQTPWGSEPDICGPCWNKGFRKSPLGAIYRKCP